MKWLSSHHMEAFQCLQFLEIWKDEEVESLGEGGEVLRSCSSSLRSLTIEDCRNLKSVYGGLEHLTALESLRIYNCPNLMLSEQEEKERGDGSVLPWESLNHSLHTLDLLFLPQLVNLPNWIQNLTALQTLLIDGCEELESLPPWMSNLTSLRELHLIRSSTRLKERCQDSTGEDWPHIKHISSIVIKDKDW